MPKTLAGLVATGSRLSVEWYRLAVYIHHLGIASWTLKTQDTTQYPSHSPESDHHLTQNEVLARFQYHRNNFGIPMNFLGLLWADYSFRNYKHRFYRRSHLAVWLDLKYSVHVDDRPHHFFSFRRLSTSSVWRFQSFLVLLRLVNLVRVYVCVCRHIFNLMTLTCLS